MESHTAIGDDTKSLLKGAVKVGTSEAAKDSKGLSTARASLVAGKAYTVSFDYNTSGYINVINIVEKTENNKNGLK